MSNLKLLKSADSKESNLLLMKNEQLKAEIVKSIALGECSIPEELVEKFGITYENSIALLSDPQFLSTIVSFTKAKLNLTFHTEGVKKLQEIVKDNDPKIAIQGIKLAAQLTNNLKSVGTDVNINLNLEDLVKSSEKNITPQNLSNLSNNCEPIIDIEKVS